MSLLIPELPPDLCRHFRALARCADYLSRLVAALCEGTDLAVVLWPAGRPRSGRHDDPGLEATPAAEAVPQALIRLQSGSSRPRHRDQNQREKQSSISVPSTEEAQLWQKKCRGVNGSAS
jgi:hypothetical protein